MKNLKTILIIVLVVLVSILSIFLIIRNNSPSNNQLKVYIEKLDKTPFEANYSYLHGNQNVLFNDTVTIEKNGGIMKIRYFDLNGSSGTPLIYPGFEGIYHGYNIYYFDEAWKGNIPPGVTYYPPSGFSYGPIYINYPLEGLYNGLFDGISPSDSLNLIQSWEDRSLGSVSFGKIKDFNGYECQEITFKNATTYVNTCIDVEHGLPLMIQLRLNYSTGSEELNEFSDWSAIGFMIGSTKLYQAELNKALNLTTNETRLFTYFYNQTFPGCVCKYLNSIPGCNCTFDENGGFYSNCLNMTNDVMLMNCQNVYVEKISNYLENNSNS
jgi:hypothetical protein